MHYGYADLASLRNIHNFKLGLDTQPHKRLKLSANYHWFFLATNNSPWFNAGQAPLRGRSSGASTTVGQEIDLTAKLKLTRHIGMLLGYSHFHAGPFVGDTGTKDATDFFYVQTTLNI